MGKHWHHYLLATLVGFAAAVCMSSVSGCSGCNVQTPAAPGPVAISGVKEVRPEVQVGPDGLTTEQSNVKERLRRDNLPGNIKHLYIISCYSGDVLIYSTVKGKVTSSGKRLSPTSVYTGVTRTSDMSVERYGVPVAINGRSHLTNEVLQDDGTYGHSIDYLYWYDSKNVYHVHYPTGGQMIHVSDQPLAVKKVILNLEHSKSDSE